MTRILLGQLSCYSHHARWQAGVLTRRRVSRRSLEGWGPPNHGAWVRLGYTAHGVAVAFHYAKNLAEFAEWQRQDPASRSTIDPCEH